MLRPLIIVTILLLMVPVIYVLFFTPFVDKLLLRLRLGKKAKHIRSTADAFDKDVERLVRSTRDEVEELGAAMSELSSVASRRFSDQAEERPWVMRNALDADLYWSDQRKGWVSARADATRYTADEKTRKVLPSDAKWSRLRSTTKQ